MKKTLALALSLFLAISTACKPAPIQPTPDTLDSKQTTLLIPDNEEQATRQNRLEFIPIYPCNGDFYQSEARYLITDNGTLMISVDAWNESFEIFQSISLKDSQHYTFSLALQESSGWLFFCELCRRTSNHSWVSILQGACKTTCGTSHNSERNCTIYAVLWLYE